MGKLISLEGISGTGKTTILNQLEKLLGTNPKVIFLKEVFDEPHIGLEQKIFDALYYTKDRFFDMGIPYTETMLLLARLMYQYECVINKALDSDCVVVTDRGVDSVIIAQAVMIHKKYNNVNINNFINNMDVFLKKMIRYPDKTFLLYGCPDLSLKRAECRDCLPFTIEQFEILKFIENLFEIRAEHHSLRYVKLNIRELNSDEMVMIVKNFILSE